MIQHTELTYKKSTSDLKNFLQYLQLKSQLFRFAPTGLSGAKENAFAKESTYQWVLFQTSLMKDLNYL